MTYAEIFTTATEEQLLQPLAVAIAAVAKDVFLEGIGVPNHDVRLAMVSYAGPSTRDWYNFAQQIALLLLFLNPTITASSTDEQLKTAVEGIWTVYARILVQKGVIAVAI